MPRWLVYSLLTVLCFGVWGVTFKVLGEFSPGRSQALSTVGIVPIMLALTISPSWREGQRMLRGSLLALAAGALVGLGNFAYYHALAAGAEASKAAPLSALYPVATVLLAFLLLKERPGAVQLTGIAGSLAAIYLLSDARVGEVLPAWMAYAMAPIVLWGGAGLIMKVATGDVSAELSTFWFLAAFVPLAAILYTIERFSLNLSAREWLLVGLQGASYGLGNLSLLAAYRSGGKASIVTPLTGLYPIVTIPLAIVLFHELVSRRGWVGIALALAAGVALSVEPKPPAEAKEPEA